MLTQNSSKASLSAYIDSSTKYLIQNPVKALEYTNKLLEFSILNNTLDGEMNAYKLFGSIYYNSKKYDLALVYYNKALSRISKGHDPRKMYDIYKLIGLTNKALGDSKESKRNFELYLKKAIAYKDSAAIVDANNNLALFYIDNKQYDQAIQQSLGNADINASNNEIVQQNSNANNFIVGKAYYLKGDTKNAINSLNNSFSNKEKNPPVQATEIKDIFQNSDSLVEQFSFQQSFQKNNLPDVNTSVLNNAHYNIGVNYLNDNNNPAAIQHLQNSISSDKDMTNPKAYQALAIAYEKNGSLEKSIKAYKKYIELISKEIQYHQKELLESSQLNSTIDLMNKKVELLEKEKNINSRNIQLLQQEKTLQFSQVKNRNYIIYILCFITLVLSIAVYFIVRTVNQKRVANLKLEMKSLRSQMNPHFVFNALNSVNSFISQNDERKANRFLSDFSKLMRDVLNHAEADFITLTEEINLLQHYLKLEHDRFGDHFDYSINIDSDLKTDQIKFPSMLIQPFIENAIWHGLRYLDIKGHLDLDIEKNSDKLIITIKDNGVGREKSQQLKTKNQKVYHSVGIKNIYKRINIIQRIHKTPINIDIQDAFTSNWEGNTGTIVKITCLIQPHHD